MDFSKLDLKKIYQAGGVVIIGGIALIGFTFLVGIISPIIAIAVLIGVFYYLYKKFITP